MRTTRIAVAQASGLPDRHSCRPLCRIHTHPRVPQASGLMIAAATTAVALLLAGPAVAAKWEVGKPAPVTEPGRPSVALGAAKIPNEVRPDVAELRKRGMRVVLTGEADGKAYLVDKEGIVRRDGEAPLQAGELRRFVQQWEDGRVLFTNKCARCHGEDGMDTGYPYILQLGGIGKKWTLAEIKQKLNPAGKQAHPVLVRGELFSQEEFEGLVVYVAGL